MKSKLSSVAVFILVLTVVPNSFATTFDDNGLHIVDGGSLGLVVSLGSTHVIIHDVTISEGVWAAENSTIEIFGGQVGKHVNSGFHAHNNAILTLYGVFDLPYGPLPGHSNPYVTPRPTGRFTGVLSNGDIIDHYYWIFDDASIILAPIPEPCTLLLLGVGGLLIRKR